MYLTKCILSATICLSLLSQTSLWAIPSPEENPVSLTAVQAQARQDSAMLKNMFTGKAPYLVFIGVLATSSIFLAYYNKTLREKISSLDRSVEWEKSLHQQARKDAQRAESIAQEIQHEYETLERQNQQLWRRIRQEEAAQRTQLSQAALLEKAYQQRLDLFKQKLSLRDYLLNQDPSGPVLQAEMKRYEPLLNHNLPKVQQESLRQELEASHWFRAMSKKEQKQFYTLLNSLTHAKGSNDYFLTATKQALDTFMTTQTTEAGKRVMALVRNHLTKRNLLLSGILVFAAISVSAKEDDTEAQKMAQRIYHNVDLLLNATPEELAQLESNPITYAACLDNAAALHELTRLDSETLQEIQRAAQPGRPALQLRPVRAH